MALRRDLHARDQVPLHEREYYPDHSADGNYYLRRQLGKQRRSHPRRNPSSPGTRLPENAEPKATELERELKEAR